MGTATTTVNTFTEGTLVIDLYEEARLAGFGLG
jgi:hypothetical protein